MQESAKAKQIQAQKRLECYSNPNTQVEQQLVFSRKLGYQEEAPGSDQWHMLNQPHEVCWICDKQIRSFIFWFGGMEKEPGVSIPTDQEEKVKLKTQLERNFINQDCAEELKTSQRTPLIMGQFTDWQPQHMFKLADYLQLAGPLDERMDAEYLLRKFKQHQKDSKASHKKDPLDDINKTAEEKFNTMDSVKRGILNLLKQSQFEKIYGGEKWHYKFENCFGGFKKPFLINAMFAMNKHFADIYIYPTFISSGRQRYVIQKPHGDREHKLNNGLHAKSLELYRTCADYRTEDLTPWLVSKVNRIVDRTFIKSQSVFALWKEDNDQIKADCLKVDIVNRKTQSYIKNDPDEVDRVEQVFEENFAPLKEIFIEKACQSLSFPKITPDGFNQMLKELGFVNKKQSTNYYARLFAAAEATEVQKANSKNINRGQFFELLLRLAGEKYYLEEKSYSNSLQCLIREDLMQKLNFNSKNQGNWSNFRKDGGELYSYEVNAVLQQNLDNLKEVYKHFAKQHLKSKQIRPNEMTVQEGIRLYSEHSDLTGVHAQYVVAMSLMTKTNDRLEDYKTLSFVEFLESVGRAAQLKFTNTSKEFSTTLAEKIEYLLDDLFEAEPLNMQRNEVVYDGEEVDEEFESDQEY